MNKAIRLLVVGCTSIVALALAGSAMAAYTSPRLLVTGPTTVGGGGGTTIHVESARADEATFRVVIYVPQGYTSSTGHPANTTIGTVVARAQAGPTSDVILPLEGNIIAVDPAPYRTNPQALGCIAGGTPTATTRVESVWILRLTVSGQTLDVPAYVNPITSGPEAAFASAKLTVCLPSPYVPEAQGGARFGAKLLSATLRFNGGVFANPTSRGQFRWTSVWTPYTINTATPNPAATVETQSIVRLPVQATMNLRRLRGNRLAIFGGTSEAGVGVGGATMRVTATGPRRFAIAFRTNARGNYSRVVRITRKGTYRLTLRVRVAQRNLGTAGCTKVATAGTALPCLNATVGGYTRTVTRSFRWR